MTPQEILPSYNQTNSIQIEISEDLQKDLVQIILEDYEAAKLAKNSRDYGESSKGDKYDFKDWFKALKDLYNARRLPKTEPWKFCSNRSLRIAAAILDLLHSRLYSAIVNEDLVRFRPTNISSVPKSERIQKLMYWWIWVHSKMRAFFDDWVKLFVGFGDVMTETTWKCEYDESEDTEIQPVLDQMGNQLINQDGTPSQVVSKKMKSNELSQSKIYMKDQVYLQKGSRDIQREPVIFEEEFFYRELEQGEVEGKFVNVTNILKNQIPMPSPSSTNTDPKEAERLKNIRLRNQPVKTLKAYIHFDYNGDGIEENLRVIISPEYRIFLSGVKTLHLTKTGKRPINFKKYDSRLEDPEENFGEGVLEKVKELAEEIDAIFNQFTDSNTLSILRPGFYDPSGDIEAPILKLAPNKMTPVTDPTHNIYFPEFQIQTDRLINAIRLVTEFIERLTAASSYVLGKESEIVGGSGTATRTNAIISSAEQRFALPQQRAREGIADIIRTHLDVLQLNIPPGLENRILGQKNEPLFKPNELSSIGISGEFDCYLLEDPSNGNAQTDQQVASMLYSILLQNMIVGTDPAKIYKVTANLIKAYGKNPEEYLGPEPDWDNIDSPEDENTLIVQGQFKRVRAQISENHMLHIKTHMELLQSPTLAGLPPHLAQEVIQMTQMHIQEHQQMMQIMLGIMQKFGSSGGQGKIGQDGEQSSGAQGTEGTPEQSGLEQLSGPLGEALNTSRTGEVANPENA